MVSIAGEKLHLNHIQSAVDRASQEAELLVLQFRVIPDEERLRHDLLVEFQHGDPDASSLAAFLASFDRHLQGENHEYRSKRRSGRLGAPELSVMRLGWSEEICRAEFRNGCREPQHKWKALGVAWDVDSRAAVAHRVGPLS